MARQKLGPKQLEWLDRMRVAGGRVYLVVDREASPTVSAWLLIDGGDDVRVPLRMMESLMERGLFEQQPAEPGVHRVMYKMRAFDG